MRENDDSAEEPDDSRVRFFEQTENALVHGGVFVDRGRRFESVAARGDRTLEVADIDPDGMTVRLADGAGRTQTVHWPSEGGQFRPVDRSADSGG